ncbi:hypothetical protein H5410_027299 [Solanum commersonii]|uniref:Uncharacterized protein n=1 Tax=Solanum commersonii TaxID=4109 RepID=A0A9J5Z1L0_SOLCO|nr:hypothetical protein H5410_027299 [Solanum commersonii]
MRGKYHWALWKNLSFPYDEGGVGMTNLKDVFMAFQYKQWWCFRSKQTLWGDFLKAKYCQRSNPISVGPLAQFSTGSNRLNNIIVAEF